MSIIKNVKIWKTEVKIPIYNQTIWFIAGNPYDVQDYLSDVYVGDFTFDPRSTNAICLHQGTTSWIWISDDCKKVSILIHELLHAVLDLAEDIGLNVKDQEAVCYLLEFLVEECQKSIFAIQMDHINQVSMQVGEVQ